MRRRNKALVGVISGSIAIVSILIVVAKYKHKSCIDENTETDSTHASSIGGTPQGVVLWTKWGGPLSAECGDWLALCPGPLPLAEPGHVQW